MYLSSQLLRASNFSSSEKQMFVCIYTNVYMYVYVHTHINSDLEIVNVNAILPPLSLKRSCGPVVGLPPSSL